MFSIVAGTVLIAIVLALAWLVRRGGRWGATPEEIAAPMTGDR